MERLFLKRIFYKSETKLKKEKKKFGKMINTKRLIKEKC